jgi:hypothetical protein
MSKEGLHQCGINLPAAETLGSVRYLPLSGFPPSESCDLNLFSRPRFYPSPLFVRGADGRHGCRAILPRRIDSHIAVFGLPAPSAAALSAVKGLVCGISQSFLGSHALFGAGGVSLAVFQKGGLFRPPSFAQLLPFLRLLFVP